MLDRRLQEVARARRVLAQPNFLESGDRLLQELPVAADTAECAERERPEIGVCTHERWGLLLDAFASPSRVRTSRRVAHRAEEVPAVPFGPDRLGQKPTDALVVARSRASRSRGSTMICP
jgi:hypothetical protein